MRDLNLKLQAHCLDFSLIGKFYNHALSLVYTHPCMWSDLPLCKLCNP